MNEVPNNYPDNLNEVFGVIYLLKTPASYPLLSTKPSKSKVGIVGSKGSLSA
jgi:hypothetical protein